MNIIITEQQFRDLVQKCVTEGVYVNDIRGNKAMLSYNKGSNWHAGNLATQDKIKTDKMDANNDDTYIIPLKGGIVSYNITDISGENVMHYFKYYWDNKKAEITFKNRRGKEQNYELEMQKREFNEFLQQFIGKVSRVVRHYLLNNNVGKIAKISIYPVPSSSRFNENMANELLGMSIGGLPIQVIDQHLFYKDTSNIQKDNDFINKNKEYYNSPAGETEKFQSSVSAFVDTAVNKFGKMGLFQQYVEKLSEETKTLLGLYYRFNHGGNVERQLVNAYKSYCDLYDEARIRCAYEDSTEGKSGKKFNFSTFAEKMASDNVANKRGENIWKIIKADLRGYRSPVTGKPYAARPVSDWVFSPLQVKSLSNGERMGLKNFFSLNTEILQKEIQRINGTLFIIFDDNISGGATLSDICMQAKKAGIKNILPITFGKMNVSWSKGGVTLNRPTDKNGNLGSFNY